MKRKVTVHPETLSRNLPPPSETFAADTMAQLRALAAKEEVPVMKRKVLQTILIAALLMALLAATALAISTLRRSAGAAQLTEARQALMDAYGLTPETVGLFTSPEPSQQGKATVYLFEGAGADPDKLGTYTVVLSPDADPVVTWSHDALDPALWEGLSLDAAPAWGQAQMLQILRDKADELASWGETDWDNLTLADKAEMGYGFFRMLSLEDGLSLENAAPEPGDFPPAQAQALAEKAVMDTYGISAEALAAYRMELNLGVPRYENGPRQYCVSFYLEAGPHQYSSFDVGVDAADGAILGCQWATPPALRTLPEGPLAGYPQAVAEFIAEDGFTYASAADKADILARIREAGLEKLLLFPDPGYVAPGPEDLSEADAVAAGAQALADAFGFTPDTLQAFYGAPSAALVALDDGSRQWVLAYAPTPLSEHPELSQIAGRLGTYQVLLAGDTGEVQDASWSWADPSGGEAYTRETLRDASVYPATALPLLLEIERELDALIARNPTYEETHVHDFSLADYAEYYRLTQAAGIQNYIPGWIPSVPGPEHLPEAEALAIAKQALAEEMGFTAEELDNAAVMTEFTLVEGRAQWGFQIFLRIDGIEQGCGVTLDAETGEVLRTGITTGGNG